MADRLGLHRIIDEDLTALMFGYTNSEAIANKIFPVVTSRKESGLIRQFGKEAFRYYAAKRAIGADSNLIRTNRLPPIRWDLDEYDLAESIDYREQSESEDDLEAMAAQRLMDLMILAREKRVADLVQNTALYVDDNTSTPGVKWDDPDSTPIEDIAAANEGVRENIGQNANSIVIGAPAWFALKQHPDFLGRTSNNQTRIVTPSLISEILEIPNVYIGKMVMIDDDDTQSDIWGDTATLFYQPGGNLGARSYKSPGFGYTIQKKNWPAVDKYGNGNSGGKVQNVRVTSIEGQFFQGSVAGYHLSNVVS